MAPLPFKARYAEAEAQAALQPKAGAEGMAGQFLAAMMAQQTEDS